MAGRHISEFTQMAWCGPLAHTVALCQIHINDHQHLGTTALGVWKWGTYLEKWSLGTL